MDKVYDRVVLATAEYELAPEVAKQLRGDKGEKGADGVGYTDINLEGEELVFHRTDGEDQRVPAPKGKDGKPGKDGVSPPAPNLTVGDVVEGEAAATVTGSYPDLKLNLTIPRGATGAKGDVGSAGPKGDTGSVGPRGERGETGAKGADAEPLNLAVTASTLAAGSEATAQLSGDYPNLTLALGLPAGAKGDAGVGLPGPKGERGDVTVTQQGMVFGEGFPEGKVTANPGTVYTDTAMTNGAVQWIKKTGTGATGWGILKADSGWRKIITSLDKDNFSDSGTPTYARFTDSNLELAISRNSSLSDQLFFPKELTSYVYSPAPLNNIMFLPNGLQEYYGFLSIKKGSIPFYVALPLRTYPTILPGTPA